MENVEQTIISQYATSPTIVALIHNMNEYIDPRTDFDAFYNFVWNIDTAQGFGLDIWGRIVGVRRELEIEGDELYFGFDVGVPSYAPFDEAPFYDGVQSTSTFRLSDNAYRALILVKALSNISSCTSPAINQLLRNLFGNRGRAYVNDLGNMTMRYMFEFYLAPYEEAIVKKSGALPHGAGVMVRYDQIPQDTVFGFSEMGGGVTPFDDGTFY